MRLFGGLEGGVLIGNEKKANLISKVEVPVSENWIP
jgi:hypothetical protein